MSVLSTAALCALYLHHERGLFGPHAGAKHADVLAGIAKKCNSMDRAGFTVLTQVHKGLAIFSCPHQRHTICSSRRTNVRLTKLGAGQVHQEQQIGRRWQASAAARSGAASEGPQLQQPRRRNEPKVSLPDV